MRKKEVLNNVEVLHPPEAKKKKKKNQKSMNNLILTKHPSSRTNELKKSLGG